ncbi:hypothetical protein [Flavisphingomonas formosensis]|uniref:hypothetical protein n=1 Tax=Flavisphingomonas formosensis TaxID=861534 RepID=UPI0012F817BE|nr:hypothetical protein [Sphingomonas formosensis]
MMLRSTGIALALAVALTGSPSQAADGAQVYALTGTCGVMTIDGNDLASQCDGKLVSFTTPNGRVGFIFTVGDMMLTFSGRGEDQTSLAGERASQPIDTIRLAHPDQDPEKLDTRPGSGTCVYGNPFARAMTVSCTVTAQQQLYRGEFVTDGTPPAGGAM